MDADDVITDEQLAGYVGGMKNLADILPEDWINAAENDKTAKPAKQAVVDRILKKLAKRTPPIEEADITDPTELAYITACGTLDFLYRAAPFSEGSANLKRADYWAGKFDDELDSLLVTVDEDGDGEEDGAASPLSVWIERA